MIASLPILPLRSSAMRGGPAPVTPSLETDIIDEAITFFRANILFRNFEIKGAADKMLVWLTVYITQCLQKLQGVQTKQEAQRVLYTMAQESIPLPPDRSFLLARFVSAPEKSGDAETLRLYFRQLREELGNRLVEKVYPDGTPSKWWMQFSRRKFQALS